MLKLCDKFLSSLLPDIYLETTNTSVKNAFFYKRGFFSFCCSKLLYLDNALDCCESCSVLHFYAFGSCNILLLFEGYWRCKLCYDSLVSCSFSLCIAKTCKRKYYSTLRSLTVLGVTLLPLFFCADYFRTFHAHHN